MLDIVLWLFFTGVVGIILLMVIEQQVERLAPTNRFKMWWRRHFVGDDIYDDY